MDAQNDRPEDPQPVATDHVEPIERQELLTIKKPSPDAQDAPFITRSGFHKLIHQILREAGIRMARDVAGMQIESEGLMKSLTVRCKASIIQILKAGFESRGIEAIKNMLPNNKLRKHFLAKLKVFKGAEHTHEAQKPVPLEI